MADFTITGLMHSFWNFNSQTAVARADHDILIDSGGDLTLASSSGWSGWVANLMQLFLCCN